MIKLPTATRGPNQCYSLNNTRKGVIVENVMSEQRAIFIDRDGVVIHDRGLLHRKELVELIPKSAEAIQLLHREGYLVIMVTNQPVVAR